MTMRASAKCVVLTFLLAAGLMARPAAGQELTIKLRDNDQPRPMTAAELSQLRDPLFRLVIQRNPRPLNLSQIEEAIQPVASSRKTFVVSERIHEQGGQEGLRAVLAFTGINQGIDVGSAIFLSVFFSRSSFPDLQAVEALAWDSDNGVYNYYKLERVHGSRFTWHFRGSSRGADVLAPAARADSCFACHTNGAPVMKELFFPWNNWHSDVSNSVAGLVSFDQSLRWPVARAGSGDAHLTDAGRLLGGDQLELMIISAMERFNKARLQTFKAPPGAGGQVAISDSRRLLRPLFETTEVNLISTRRQSEMNPFSPNQQGRPGGSVCPPHSFFLNAGLLIDTLKIEEARAIGAASTFQCPDNHPFAIKPDEYRDLLGRAGQNLGGNAPQDAHFAWFVPEPSFIDNNMVALLIKEGVITPEFAAAVLTVDLRTPVFSGDRASLLTFLPNSFSHVPLQQGADPFTPSRHPDALTREVIARLEAANPPAGSPAAEALVLLRQDKPLDELRRRVVRYRGDLESRLAPGSQSRSSELDRLHGLARARRAHVRNTAPFNSLVESEVLLPR